MKKYIDKVYKYIPWIYVIFLPLEFGIHMAGGFFPYFGLITSTMLGILKILVIAAFSYYLIKDYKLEKADMLDPSTLLTIMAGVSFLELVFNTIMTGKGNYVSAFLDKGYYNWTLIRIFAAFIFVEFVLDSTVFYYIMLKVNEAKGKLWNLYNIAIVITIFVLSVKENKNIGSYILIWLLFIVRAVKRILIFRAYNKRTIETVEIS